VNRKIADITIPNSNKFAVAKCLITDKVSVHDLAPTSFLISRFIFAEKANKPDFVVHSL
jgi:hypothetical protein